MKKLFYAVFNYYGNQVVGHDSLHVFESKEARDQWVNEDYEKHEQVLASDPLARKFNGTWDVDFRYTYHYSNGTAVEISRHDGIQYEEKR